MRSLTPPCFNLYIFLILLGLACSLSPAGAQQANAQPAYHGIGYVTFVDPDRQRVGFVDQSGTTYTLDTYSAAISVPALNTGNGTTGDLVKDMRISVEGTLLSSTIIAADRVRVLPYVAPAYPLRHESAPSHTFVRTAPAVPGPVDLQGVVTSYQPMEESNLDYDIYTVRVGDHDRNVRVGGPDIVQGTSGQPLEEPLAPGDRVHVEGTLLAGGDIAATVITRLVEADETTGQRRFEGGNVLHGTISAEATVFSRDLTVRVRDTDVTVNVPSGIPVSEDGHPISVHYLANHEHVTVYGHWTSGDHFKADRIEAQSKE